VFGPVVIPRLVGYSKRCDRCGLLYPKKAARCTHCAELGDRQLELLRLRREGARKRYASLAKIFALVALLLLVSALWIR
jgi:hypothetical protein